MNKQQKKEFYDKLSSQATRVIKDLESYEHDFICHACYDKPELEKVVKYIVIMVNRIIHKSNPGLPLSGVVYYDPDYPNLLPLIGDPDFKKIRIDLLKEIIAECNSASWKL
jgi:hypothetical protein